MDYSWLIKWILTGLFILGVVIFGKFDLALERPLQLDSAICQCQWFLPVCDTFCLANAPTPRTNLRSDVSFCSSPSSGAAHSRLIGNRSGARLQGISGSSQRTGKRLAVSTSPSPCCILTGSGRVFSRGSYARSDPLRAMRLAGRSLLLRKILHHLQGTAERAPLLRRPLLLP